MVIDAPVCITSITNAHLGCALDDAVGCSEDLVCGVDNCAKFHELGAATGLVLRTDCCERKWE